MEEAQENTYVEIILMKENVVDDFYLNKENKEIENDIVVIVEVPLQGGNAIVEALIKDENVKDNGATTLMMECWDDHVYLKKA